MLFPACLQCGMAMDVTNYEDVLIDCFPNGCRVCFDRRELQKVSAHVCRQEVEMVPDIFDHPSPRRERSDRGDDRDRKHHRYDLRGDWRGRKKKGFGLWNVLEEIRD